MYEVSEWQFLDLFDVSFWQQIFISKPTSNSNNSINQLWKFISQEIQTKYFHNSIDLFSMWASELTAPEKLNLFDRINNVDDSLEQFIVSSSSYENMLIAAEANVDDMYDNHRITNNTPIDKFLNQIFINKSLLYMTYDKAMLGGTDAIMINDVFMKMLQSGYQYRESLDVISNTKAEPGRVFVFDTPLNVTPTYLSLS